MMIVLLAPLRPTPRISIWLAPNETTESKSPPLLDVCDGSRRTALSDNSTPDGADFFVVREFDLKIDFEGDGVVVVEVEDVTTATVDARVAGTLVVAASGVGERGTTLRLRTGVDVEGDSEVDSVVYSEVGMVVIAFSWIVKASSLSTESAIGAEVHVSVEVDSEVEKEAGSEVGSEVDGEAGSEVDSEVGTEVDFSVETVASIVAVEDVAVFVGSTLEAIAATKRCNQID